MMFKSKASTWLAWSPILLMVVRSVVFSFLPSTLLCEYMNANEKICGGRSLHPSLQIATAIAFVGYYFLTATTAFLAVRRKLTAFGFSGFVISALLGVFLACVLFATRGDNGP